MLMKQNKWLSLHIAETANHYYTTVGLQLAAQIKSLPSDDSLKYIRNISSPRIKFKLVRNTQVLEHLQNLNWKSLWTGEHPCETIERFGRIHFLRSRIL